jgi:hypothetical protein
MMAMWKEMGGMLFPALRKNHSNFVRKLSTSSEFFRTRMGNGHEREKNHTHAKAHGADYGRGHEKGPADARDNLLARLRVVGRGLGERAGEDAREHRGEDQRADQRSVSAVTHDEVPHHLWPIHVHLEAQPHVEHGLPHRNDKRARVVAGPRRLGEPDAARRKGSLLRHAAWWC